MPATVQRVLELDCGEGGFRFVWQPMLDVAQRNNDPMNAEHNIRLHDHFPIERSP